MNGRENMIIIKGEIKTSAVRSCHYNKNSGKTEVVFSNGRKYSYNPENVEWIVEPELLDAKACKIYTKRGPLYNIENVYVFRTEDEEYYHICFANGSERDFRQHELHIVGNCLDNEKARDTFAYIKQIAELSDIRNEESGEKILPKRFAQIDFVGEDVALARYLRPGAPGKGKGKGKGKTTRECTPIFPFGCNRSQYKAVKTAMENQISVIQGPPGTGKTQTILNIIANILMEGKTVIVVSNNNAATDNVYEKLSAPKYGLGFIAAALGSVKNKRRFIAAQKEAYPPFAAWKYAGDENALLKAVTEKSAGAGRVFAQQEKLARLRQDKGQLSTEQQHFAQYLKDSGIMLPAINVRKKLPSASWMKLWQDSLALAESAKKPGFFYKLIGRFRYGIKDWSFYENDIAAAIAVFQHHFYAAKADELAEQIESTEESLHGKDGALLAELCRDSLVLLKNKLAQKYDGRERRPLFTEEDLWKNPQKVLDEYPLILSTTFSSRSSLSAETVYDYLIMDEASQVDIATGALALSCARNVVIVGDTKQLPNIVSGPDRQKADAIFNSFKIAPGYQFTKSFLQSLIEVLPDVPQTLLREHYRCHPKIINFCNQKFYHGDLIVMTEDKGEKDVLAAVRTAPGQHARDHYSQRQIDVIKNEIMPLYNIDPATTGIISPYRNQAQALENTLPAAEASTVHKFQGREKDTIIISTVDDEISDFADDPYLLNVAVSRAKKRLFLVMTGNRQEKERNITDLLNYIRYNNFEVTDSKIYSIFDYLYGQFSAARKSYLQKHKRISEYDSENLMSALLEEILGAEKYRALAAVDHYPLNLLVKDRQSFSPREREYFMNPLTHVDFVIFNRITKKALLAIEVDGYAYHQAGSRQAERDAMKNDILRACGIPLLRFKTNGSQERAALCAKLDELLGAPLS